MFSRLLAKSVPFDGAVRPSLYLPQHLADVVCCAEAVRRATLIHQCRALRLGDDAAERFGRVLSMAAVLHDLGKANDHFQGMIWETQERQGRVQGLRHEWVTILMLLRPKLLDWLRSASDLTDLDWQIVQWAIAGHHPAFGRSSPPVDRTVENGSGSRMILLSGHADFAACLEVIRQCHGLGPAPTFEDETVDIGDAHSEIRRHWNPQVLQWREDLQDQSLGLVAAVKASLLGADVAGSALPTECGPNSDLGAWIKGSLSKTPTSQQLAELIDDRLSSDGNRQTLRPFQRKVAELGAPAEQNVALVQAGCGSGKTLAAYLWAQKCCPNRRLYMCYPTTGTATEGFRDYLVSGESPKFDAELFHSRADEDLEILDVRYHDSDADRDSEYDTSIRIDSLAAWSTPIVCCTVDTVLGLIQNHRRALYSWPALAGAALVFDEIHSYDTRLFGALLKLLRHLPGIPVLLMTASLPRHRLESLTGAVQSGGRQLCLVEGPKELESLPRYCRAEPWISNDSQQALHAAKVELQRGGKVLWVANTVNRAMEFADQAKFLNPLIYHSRFRYEDRVQRHGDVVNAFKGQKPALAICTQVAEMSLDLSATLLITDLAPIPALIQRLGRLNRRARAASDGARPLLVVEPKNVHAAFASLPYDAQELALAQSWLAELPEVFSQADLVAAWHRVGDEPPDRPECVDSAWLDGGPKTDIGELRESSPGISVLLDADLPKAQRQPKQLPRFVIPMPPPGKKPWRSWERFRGIPVAPSDQINYDPQRGAQWPNAK